MYSCIDVEYSKRYIKKIKRVNIFFSIWFQRVLPPPPHNIKYNFQHGTDLGALMKL